MITIDKDMLEKFRPWQDLNLQSPVSETDALSIRPQGRSYSVHENSLSGNPAKNHEILFKNHSQFALARYVKRKTWVLGSRSTHVASRWIDLVLTKPCLGRRQQWGWKPASDWLLRLQHYGSWPIRWKITSLEKWRARVCCYNSAGWQQLCCRNHRISERCEPRRQDLWR